MRAVDNKLLSDDAFFTAHLEGKIEGETIGLEKGLEKGEAIGLEKGEAIGLEKAVINGFQGGYSMETISSITGLTSEQIIDILKKHGLTL